MTGVGRPGDVGIEGGSLVHRGHDAVRGLGPRSVSGQCPAWKESAGTCCVRAGMCAATTLAANGARVVIAEVDSAKAGEAVKTFNDPSGRGAAAGLR